MRWFRVRPSASASEPRELPHPRRLGLHRTAGDELAVAHEPLLAPLQRRHQQCAVTGELLLVLGEAGNRLVVASAPPKALPEVGSQVRLCARADPVRLFDARAEKAL